MAKLSHPHPRTLARLKRALRAYGIRQAAIAERAHVTHNTVSQVLAGRTKSWNVVNTAKQMLAETAQQVKR